MGRGTHGDVSDRSGDPLGCPGQVGGPSRRFGTGWGTLLEVWDGSEDPLKVRDGSEDPFEGPGWVVGPSQSSGMGREILGEVWDGTGDPLGGLGRVGGPSRMYGTRRGTFG